MNNQVEQKEVTKMKVYRRENTVTDENGDEVVKVSYTGARSDGKSIRLVFACEVPTTSKIFEISDVEGNAKENSQFKTITYFIDKCVFHEVTANKLML